MRPSIVHIGPGAFHQAHQAFYCHEVLATGAPSGGIRAVSLRSDTLHRALTRQQHEYSLLERDNERYQLRRITSICDTASVQSDGIEAVLERLTDPDVNIATLTVTEKGYCAVATTGALDTLRPEIAHDIAHPTQPCSMPGFLVEALARRRARGLAPLTVCSCDNLPSNGPATRRMVSELAEHRGGDLADWIRGSVAFPASMVDRMVPAPTDAVRATVHHLTGFSDACAVATEPFSQWVLEDTFPTGRPPWERVGVELVADVTAYERTKVRILNGAHSALAYLGMLVGHREIANAVADPAIRAVVVAMVQQEILPTVSPPPGLDLSRYTETVLTRFANRPLRYTTRKVASDGSEKLPIRILATVSDRLASGGGTSRLALVVAAYAACLLGPRADEFAVSDPTLDRLRGQPARSADDASTTIEQLLSLEAIFGRILPQMPTFRDEVLRHALSLWRGDVALTLAASC